MSNCTCPNFELMHKTFALLPGTCICNTCMLPECVLGQEERRKDEEIEMSCSCTYRDTTDVHCYDQGGYNSCSCSTCIDPICVGERIEYRRREREQEAEDYRTYQRLKERFG